MFENIKRNIPVVQIVFSPTGGTRKAADILAKQIAGVGEIRAIDICGPDANCAGATVGREEIALIAVPSYGGRVPALALENMARISANGARAVLACVYGNRAYDNTLAQLQDAAQNSGFNVIAAVAALAEHSVVRQLAAGRPDEADTASLQKMAESIAEKICSGDLSAPAVPGEVPEARAGGPGMAPGKTEECVQCGICAQRCPVGAIDLVSMQADGKKCISCMRCISVCPKKARRLNRVITSLGGVALEILCGNRKECELFL